MDGEITLQYYHSEVEGKHEILQNEVDVIQSNDTHSEETVKENVAENNPNCGKVTDESYNKGNILKKLKHIMYSMQLCGLCMENEDGLISIYNCLEIDDVGVEDRNVSINKLLSYIFNDISDLPATSYICKGCIDKAVVSYIFIQNTKRSAKTISGYLNNFHSKISLVEDQIDPLEDHSDSNYLIVIERNTSEDSEVKECTKENPRTLQSKDSEESTKPITGPTLILDGTNDLLQIKQEIQARKRMPLASKIVTAVHDSKENGPVKCYVCFKTFTNERCLAVHYKNRNRGKCRICQMVLLNSHLQLHLKLHHEESVYSCDYCNVVFYTENALAKHVKTHSFENDKTGNLQCIMCFKYFSKDLISSHPCRFKCTDCVIMPCLHQKYLTAYRENILNCRTNKCPDCEYVCTKKYSFIEHVNREHLDFLQYKCEMCDMKYYSNTTLEAHKRRSHSSDIVCEYCDQVFENVDEFAYHNVEKCKSYERELKCDECKASFDTFVKLSIHKDFRHKQFHCRKTNDKKSIIVQNQTMSRKRNVIKTVFQCPLCKIIFGLKGDYLRHITKVHGPHYTCDECNENFNEIKSFLLHYNQKHSESLVCELCGKSFKTQRKLALHRKYAHGDPKPCHICNKLIRPISVKSHTKWHMAQQDPSLKQPVDPLKVKTYKCDSCERAFSSKALLTSHINRNHLKIKPYVCGVCRVAYSCRYQLNEHMISHSEEKWHRCNICDKTLRHRITFKKHMMLHTGERPHVCDMCGEGFITVNRLKEHINRHSGKKLSCPLCDRKFYLIKNLRYHIKNGHWEKKDQPFDPRLVEGLTEEHDYIFQDGRLAVVD